MFRFLIYSLVISISTCVTTLDASLVPSPGFKTSIPIVWATEPPTTRFSATATPTNTVSSPGISDTNKIIAIAVSIGGAFLLACIIAVTLWIVRRRKQRRGSTAPPKAKKVEKKGKKKGGDRAIPDTGAGLETVPASRKRDSLLSSSSSYKPNRNSVMTMDTEYEKKMSQWRSQLDSEEYSSEVVDVDDDVALEAGGGTALAAKKRSGSYKEEDSGKKTPIPSGLPPEGGAAAAYTRRSESRQRSSTSSGGGGGGGGNQLPRGSTDRGIVAPSQRSSMASARTSEWIEGDSAIAGTVLAGALIGTETKRQPSDRERKDAMEGNLVGNGSHSGSDKKRSRGSVHRVSVDEEGVARKSAMPMAMAATGVIAVPVMAASAMKSGSKERLASANGSYSMLPPTRDKVSPNMSEVQRGGFPVPVKKVQSATSDDASSNHRERHHHHHHRNSRRATPSLPVAPSVTPVIVRTRQFKLPSDDEESIQNTRGYPPSPADDAVWLNHRSPSHLSEQTGQVMISDDDAAAAQVTVGMTPAMQDYQDEHLSYSDHAIPHSESEESVCSSCIVPPSDQVRSTSWLPHDGIAEETEEDLYDEEEMTGDDDLMIEEEVAANADTDHEWMNHVMKDVDRRLSTIR